MDPNAAWENLLEALESDDRPASEEAVAALLTWLDSGGFPPQTIANCTMSPRWNRAVAYAACLATLADCNWRQT
jgi:hypothetical protein